jgi:FlgD Ig-like domain
MRSPRESIHTDFDSELTIEPRIVREGREMKSVTLFLMLVIQPAFGQPTGHQEDSSPQRTWDVPFASRGNTVSLTVANNASIDASQVSVILKDPPDWLVFEATKAFLKDITAGDSKDAEFSFSVERKAPVGEVAVLEAVISTSSGQEWSKEISVRVSPPKEYKLYDNFPNPFNPSTKIAFELPKASHLRLGIYDMVGREVRVLVDGSYPPGYTELLWDGRNNNGLEVASGVYFYRIATENWGSVKKMMMVK